MEKNSNMKLDEDWINKLMQIYAQIDRQYYVFKIEDLLNSISKVNYIALSEIFNDYNNYREELRKEENYYLVLNRDEFPMFSTGSDFVRYMRDSLHEKDPAKALSTFMSKCPSISPELQEKILKCTQNK